MSKVALVTGGSSGIGAMIAEELHKAGFKTVAAARRLEKMASLQALGVTAVQLDVTDEASTDRCLAEIRSSVGEIDILVNCAG
ncbi:MAG: SDR family NAD(P)-dependent oxidoreductase, partial [Gammaproteobacteria bacterium]|nr:SDR family NAD(P)-dependent oxidoreductase [Gammaproteobacteria bacterium]